ncbi:hypothetical protein PR003_g13590 [Phytophthora rubi]|uniref:Reverse transcriptase RNase H-like domain-containing protein n=1 Tax=Phytophthora rubi TaxID=129364 RepID=A0A6A4F551_9STRA|nr:hypothetical protein PR003_g13590 [Phytophthora rubi]
MANGMIVSMFGPIEGRRHDSFMLEESKVMGEMSRMCCARSVLLHRATSTTSLCTVALRTDSAPSTYIFGICASKSGVRVDPEKISSICSWPMPKNQTELRQWLGLANYLHKYTKDYAGLIQPMSSLLKKDVA